MAKKSTTIKDLGYTPKSSIVDGKRVMKEPTASSITKVGYITDDKGTSYKLGSTEATNYLLQSNKPVSTSTVQRGTTNVRNQINDSLTKFDTVQNNFKNQAGDGLTTENTTTTTDNQSQRYSKNPDGTFTPIEEEVATDEYVSPYETTEFKKKEKDINSRAEQEANKNIKELEKLQKQMSATSNSMIQNIKQTFQNRISEMKMTNQKQAEFEKNVGLRTGRARYAPVIQQGIITDEEQQGILRISNLEAQMNTAIIAAEQAKNEGNLKMLNAMMKVYEDSYNKAQNEIKDLYTLTRQEEQDRLARDKEERLAFEGKIKAQQESAKTYAPTVKKYLDGLTTAAEKTEFINKYAQKVGIEDPDLLVAALEEYGLDYEKDLLDIESKKQSISSSRDAQYRANTTASRTAIEKAEKANEYLIDVENIIDGAMTLDDVSSANQSKVRKELREYGLYSATPPQWFVEMIVSSADSEGTSKDVVKEWENYRSDRGL